MAATQIKLMNTKQNHITRTPLRCAHKKYSCSALPLPPYCYCEKHLIEERGACFKQCSFTYPCTRERCTYIVTNNTANQSREYQLCREHLEELEQKTVKLKPKKYQPLLTADTIITGISHYVKNSSEYKGRERLVAATADEFIEQEKKNDNIVVDPILDLDASKINSKTNQTLNYSCEPDSDVDVVTTDNVWDNADQDSSDAEEIDVEFEDQLRHAGVFTEEEMVLKGRNTCLRLQNLLIKELNNLNCELRAARAKYLSESKKEREIYGPLTVPKNMNTKEKRQFDKLKALSNYHKLGTGPNAILFKKQLERRKAATPGMFSRSSRSYQKCNFSEYSIKCTSRCVPTSKYCKKHILHDKKQVLFQGCGVRIRESICQEPIIPIPDLACILHSTLPDEPIEESSVAKDLDVEMKLSSSDDIKVPQIKEDLEALYNCSKSDVQNSNNNDQIFRRDSAESYASEKPIGDLDLSLTDKFFEDMSKSNEPFMVAFRSMDTSINIDPLDHQQSTDNISL